MIDNDGEEKAEEQSKEDWIHQLKEHDVVDVFYVGKHSRDPSCWYGAEVTGIELKKQNNNNNIKHNNSSTNIKNNRSSKNGKNSKNSKNSKYEKNKENRKNTGEIVVHKIYVKYRTFNDTDELNLLLKTSKNDNVIDRIDKANTHADESVYCQHWRHELTSGSEVDILCGSRWLVGTCHSYIPRRGFKIKFVDNRGKPGYQVVGRFNGELIAPLGTHTTTGSDDDSNYNYGCDYDYNVDDEYNHTQTRWFSGWSWMSGNNSGSNSRSGSRRGTRGKRNKKKKTSFFKEWLNVINRVHLEQNGSTFAPRGIHNQMSNYDKNLGDGMQHDAIEALTVILHGIEESLPESLKYINRNENDEEGSELYPFLMPQSIYNNEFKWNNDMDKQICDRLVETNKLNFGGDIVSEYFQGIECICETCLNCGTQRRLYHTFNELSLPVTSSDDYVFVNLYYYSLKERKYAKICVKAPRDCNVTTLKFLALVEILQKPNVVSKLNKFDLISINDTCINSKSKKMINFARILADNNTIGEEISKCKNQMVALLIVPRICIGNGNNGNNVNGTKRAFASRVRTVYAQVDDTNDQILFCVLLFARGYFNHKWLKEELQRSQNSNKFLTHFGGKPSNCVNFCKDNFTTYCNGEISNINNHDYFLNDKSTNVIIGYFASKFGQSKNRRVSTKSTKRGGNRASIKSKVNGDYDSKMDDTNTSCVDDELNVHISNIIQGIKALELMNNGIKLNRIEYLENLINLLEKSMCDVASERNKYKKNDITRLFPNLKSTIAVETAENNLKAHKIVLKRLQRNESDRQDVVSKIEQTLVNFWKKYQLSRVDSVDFSETDKQLNHLEQCLAEYQSEKFMKREDMNPKFDCNCDYDVINKIVPLSFILCFFFFIRLNLVFNCFCCFLLLMK